MICKECNSKNIKSRKNYSHGKASTGKKTYTCKDCGSTKVEEERKNSSEEDNQN